MNKNAQSKKTSKGMFWRLVKYVSLSIVFLVGILGMTSTRPPNGGPNGGIEIGKVYILAFVESGTSRIRVRWSTDGQTWSSSNNFPFAITGLGVCATSSGRGAMSQVWWVDTSNKLQVVWGLGADNWDTSPAGYSTLTQSVLSGPTAAYAGESLFLVAFRTEGDVVAVRALNISTREWLSISIAPAHVNNSDVLGSPSIAILDGKVVLAWNRPGTLEIACGELQIATVGDEKLPTVDWTNIYTFSLTESGFGSPRNPALTHDGSNFYLGFVRRDQRGGYQGDWLFVHPSNDGVTWKAPIEGLLIPQDPLLEISVRSDGSLLAAFIGTSGRRGLHKYAGGTWTEILSTLSSSDAVFGSAASLKKFALISNKP